ncbi:hypothetical protein AJ87_32105 [Rhizobium yanglingense]|nr:hypothetical protein AJ87_32105 [Rhizobium yanglingense]
MLRSLPHPCPRVYPENYTGIQLRRLGGAGDSSHAKDFAWLDSCDEHRNEGGGRSPPFLLEAYLAGLYQLSRPFWSFSAATSGVSVPLMTLADSIQVSFSRFGVPRCRI